MSLISSQNWLIDTCGSDSSPSGSLNRSSAPNFNMAASSSLLNGFELEIQKENQDYKWAILFKSYFYLFQWEAHFLHYNRYRIEAHFELPEVLSSIVRPVVSILCMTRWSSTIFFFALSIISSSTVPFVTSR